MIFEEMENGIKIMPMNREYFKFYAGILSRTGALKEELKKMKEEELGMEMSKVRRMKIMG